jgi:hypothetical protein
MTSRLAASAALFTVLASTSMAQAADLGIEVHAARRLVR